MSNDAGDRPAEVAGRVVTSVVEGLAEFSPGAHETARTALDTDEFPASADAWYPLGMLTGALGDLRSTVGADVVRELGRRAGRGAARDTGSTLASLESLDAAYRRDHRGDAGGYAFRRIGDRDGRVECTTPYPCPFDRGFVEGVAATADGLDCLTEVGTCRADGADRCTYDLQW